MLTEVADGVLVHESGFIGSNSVVVRGRSGVLLIDPGITSDELTDLADDLRVVGQPVIAGFSTHPDWDHVLWHPLFGDAPRYATARAAASMRELLSNPRWRELVAGVLPPEHAADIPMELFGQTTGLPAGSTEIPWDGPTVTIIEHRAHAAGHAALLVEQSGVLIAGDMLSDTLIPFLDLDAADPIGDYLDALGLFEAVADKISVVIPGHGTVGAADAVRARIELDRAYVTAARVVTARDGGAVDDPRIGDDAPLGWLADVHGWQMQRLAEKARNTTADEVTR